MARRPAFEPLEDRVLLDASSVFYVTIPSQQSGGVFVSGGVYRTTDRGETWEWAMGEGINTEIGTHPWGESDIDQYWFLGQDESLPETIYVTNRGTGYEPPYHYTVYRSEDAGDAWEDRFFNDPRFPDNNTEVGWLFWAESRGWGGPASGFTVNTGDADEVLYTNYGEVFLTTDAGLTWRQVYSHYADGQSPPTQSNPGRWESIGLEDTSCWFYEFDPHDANRTYICYTDIGFMRSTDRGASWIPSSDGIDWSNTVYDIAFDPAVPGRIWAACSNQHDIPHWASIAGPTAAGGVAVSDDYGETWTSLYTGLPSAPVTSIIIDPVSPVGARTLYATVWGYGVYKSTDGGASWTNRSTGILPVENRQAYVIKRLDDGTLLCTVAGRRPGNGVSTYISGGLFRSTDGALTWTNIGPSEMWRPVDFAIHPTDPDIIYVAAMDGFGHYGGVYKTTDGGTSWTRSVPDFDPTIVGWIEGFGVFLNPQDPDIVTYTTGTHGIFISTDAGATWNETDATSSPPFRNVQRITYDPADPDTVWIATFGGGVWTGPDPVTATVADTWTSVGIGGGGAFFYPAASPQDSDLLFVSSDMSGMYRSDDGGVSWTMLDWRDIQHSRSPVFHPTDPDVVYACAWNGDVLKTSSDAGVTWDVVGGTTPVWDGDTLITLSLDRGDPELMLLSGEDGLYRSTDGGATWTEVVGAPDGILGMHFDQASPAGSRVVLAANADAPFRSDDGGLTWTQKSSGLPGGGIRSFSGGSESVDAVSLIAEYQFATDATDSADGHDGVLQGDAHVADGHLVLDGIGDYVQVSDSAALEPDVFTIALWLKESETTNRVILEKDGNAG
ncbi:MAG TPA: hypothetical protein VMX57_01610, partial [Planctomycetota bacterium]|nr:hypothetical protein [Planctomycetota bacterium]